MIKRIYLKRHYLDKDIQLSLFNRSNALTLKKSLDRYANKENISLASFSAKLKVRNSKVVSKTFHRAGLVVPFNRKTDVGYRPLGESDGMALNSHVFLSEFGTIIQFFSHSKAKEITEKV